MGRMGAVAATEKGVGQDMGRGLRGFAKAMLFVSRCGKRIHRQRRGTVA